jgi:ribosomal-protein-alanine N-acetyltransferase
MPAPARPWLKHVELRGECVHLRPIGPADVLPCFRLVHDRPEVTDWLVWDGPESVEDLAPWFLTWPLGDPERGGDHHLALVDPRDGAFCGKISLKLHEHPHDGELGYWVDPERQGRGMASEAVAMAVWLAFEVLGASLVHAECFEGNVRSLRVLEKAGLVEEPLGATTIVKRGRPVRMGLHVLEREAWEAAGRPGRPGEVRLELAETGGAGERG